MSIYEEVKSTIAKLRDPQGGCPWDLKQDHQSLKKYLVEETYEVLHAIDTKRPEDLKDELGDLMLQVLLHSQIASEENQFNVDDVLQNLNEKMIRRHPHVFEKPQPGISIDELHAQWDEIKKKEKTLRPEHRDQKTFFSQRDLYAPALDAAQNIGEKSKKVNFDWPNAYEVFKKVEEEFSELQEAVALKKERFIFEEAGDLLFSVTQYLRHLGFSAENSLTSSSEKFIKRFRIMEDIAQNQNKDFSSLSDQELNELWLEAKKAHREDFKEQNDEEAL